MARHRQESPLCCDHDVFPTGLAVAGMDVKDPQGDSAGRRPTGLAERRSGSDQRRLLARVSGGATLPTPRMSIMEPSVAVISGLSGDRLYR